MHKVYAYVCVRVCERERERERERVKKDRLIDGRGSDGYRKMMNK